MKREKRKFKDMVGEMIFVILLSLTITALITINLILLVCSIVILTGPSFCVGGLVYLIFSLTGLFLAGMLIKDMILD